ncbi:GNAT family N-acetyltransferase [Brevibacillus daliensis]|uniref:GNAT family N-acetyltransferase n=1 Tax=Brevibacillus daliensis TaxID=2892995 RepID=UPI001E405375|nr:GNAT family N-acetyltransferase [Brevibacillus daliensis]
MSVTIEYRILTQIEDVEMVCTLQDAIWGKGTGTSSGHIIAALHNGGIVIGAFEQHKLVGFCYGFAGYKEGEAYLCSHLLAIDPVYRDQGIGQQLKVEQRKWALAYGYKRITWTFDPLESRNAYLNICKLGGVVRTYLPSYYGELDDDINRGLPSDRLLLEWNLISERVLQRVDNNFYLSPEWMSYVLLFSGDDVCETSVPQASFDMVTRCTS